MTPVVISGYVAVLKRYSIERLWKVMNERSRNNVYFKTKRGFKAAVGHFLTATLPEIAGSLASRVNDNFQVLKPASLSWLGIVKGHQWRPSNKNVL